MTRTIACQWAGAGVHPKSQTFNPKLGSQSPNPKLQSHKDSVVSICLSITRIRNPYMALPISLSPLERNPKPETLSPRPEILTDFARVFRVEGLKIGVWGRGLRVSGLGFGV